MTNSVDPHYGGPTTCSVNSSIAIAREGLDVTFVSSADPAIVAEGNLMTDLLRKEAVTTLLFPNSSLPLGIGRRWAISSALLQWLRREAGRFDAVIINSPWAAASLFVTMLPRSHEQGVFLVPHESWTRFDILRSGSRIKRLVKASAGRLMLSRLSGVLFSSVLERSDCYFALNDVPGVVLPHPVSEHGYISNPSTSADPSVVTFGYFGRFHPKKNVDLAIRALALLPDNCVLRIAGTGELEPALRQLVAGLGLERRVTWEGFVAWDAKARFFARCDALVMPSAYECFGMSHAEAICHGTPVITTRHTGISPIVASYGCGALVEAQPGSVAAAMRQYAQAPMALEKARASCVDAANREFAFSSYGRRLNAILRSRPQDGRVPVAG